MKTIVFLCTVLFSISFLSCTEDTVDPIPPVQSDSLGMGWQKTVIAGGDFVDIFFNSPLSGYVVGNKMYKSVDGGTSWQLAFHDSGYNAFITPDNKALFVKPDGGGLLQLTPPQTSLTLIISHIKTNGAADVFFTDNNNGFYIGSNKLYRTTDGGNQWRAGTTAWPLYGYSTLFFTSSTNGWIANLDKVYRTDGEMILSVAAVDDFSQLSSIQAITPSVLYLASRAGKVYKSTDGGSNFSLKSRLSLEGIFADIHFFNESTGYACHGGQIFKTTDGATTWTQVVSLANVELQEIHFVDANHGWACGDNGTVLRFQQ